MTIKEVKKILGITNADIAQMFGYTTMESYYYSARRKHVESGIVAFYILFLKSREGEEIE